MVQKFNLLGLIEIVSSGGELPPSLVYGLTAVLVAMAIRILFGLPVGPSLSRVIRAIKQIKRRKP